MEIIIDLQVEVKGQKKKIKLTQKESYNLEDCVKDKIIIANLINGDSYTGYFKDFDGEMLVLAPLSDGHSIGLEFEWVDNYFEEI